MNPVPPNTLPQWLPPDPSQAPPPYAAPYQPPQGPPSTWGQRQKTVRPGAVLLLLFLALLAAGVLVVRQVVSSWGDYYEDPAITSQ